MSRRRLLALLTGVAALVHTLSTAAPAAGTYTCR
jgi:hypothetical protein